ncbi:MAG: hypothetical protein JRJ13_19830 [Deltaproteobacteria bacterium]|nr:hypothetical protein [Deltaproteobacteria bacterium]
MSRPRWKKKEKEWKGLIPKWVNRVKVSGDLRLRYEGIYNFKIERRCNQGRFK